MSLLATGFGLMPHLLRAQPANKKYSIAIVGAGIAGLHLARCLKEAGHQITVFEAKDRAGGRIFHNTQFHAAPIDVGAQWIHGKNKLYKLVRQAGFPIYKDTKSGLVKVAYKNALSDDFPLEFYQLLQQITKRTPLANDQSLLSFASSISNDADFIALVENAVTDTATSTNRFSVNEIAKLTNKLKTTDYQFSSTTLFGFITAHYVNAVQTDIVYNSPIKSIDYSKESVLVYGNEAKPYAFDKVIVTVPLSILQAGAIEFFPSLPTEKQTALNQIGMDKGLKVFLQFIQPFYKHGIFNGRHAGYYIDPTKKGENGEGTLLASLVMGKHAMAYYNNPQKAIENQLAELDAYFNGQASKHFLGSLAQDWGNEAYINGVYSYTLPGGQGARAIAKQPLHNRLFFAGEAMNTHNNYGNVHGAIESAIDVLCSLT